ncbi:hypothetical protein [uncultured Pseudokineococcus sp.]|uniref:hypothetical protein n=1 Tax=uncultured Pseudokineococcus sp. TaxID=1642928 RepID=UPI002634350D|nr:hypothetical protein [uncultured Pseudokineococcus sp.]
MPTPTRRPTSPPAAAPTSRRSWLVPAAAAAVLFAAGAWLLAPTAADLLTPGLSATSSTTAPAGPAPARDEPAADQPPVTTTSTSTRAPSSAPPSDQPQQPTPAAIETAPTDTGEAPPEQQWRPVAEGFAADFAAPGEDWAQRLAAWTTPELAQAYAYTDPNRQPSADLAELEIHEEGPTSVRVLATYTSVVDGDFAIDLRVLLTLDGWRVSSAAPA